MSYKLFLDDERMPSKVSWIDLPLGPWEIVRNYDEFCNIIRTKGMPSFITFDHDLGFEHYPFNETNPNLEIPYSTYKEKTGYHCAKFLIELCIETGLKVPEFTVHSLNVVGKENITKLLNGYKAFTEKD